MSKVAVLVAEMYNEFELWYPFYRLIEAGYEPVLVGPAASPYASKAGLLATAQVAGRDAKAEDFIGMVIPGGYAPDHMRRDPALVDLVKRTFAAGKPVAAICHAGWMLASAEVVSGRRVTSFFAIKDDLIHAGAKWEDAEVVVDGNLITSRQPADLPAFMREFLKALA
jgi:protease I